jgi:hypothetical protein
MTRWDEAARALLAEVAQVDDRAPGVGGCVGDALFACVVDDLQPGAAHAAIQRAIDHMEAYGTGPTLHGGAAGLGLVVAMKRPDEDDLLSYLDEVTASFVPDLPPASLRSGVAGLALYASLRGDRESGRTLQRSVVDRLRATAIREGGGVVWHTPPGYLAARGVTRGHEPIVEYGMAHGIGGALVGLASLSARGDAVAAELARAGVKAAWRYARARPNRFGRVLFGPGGRDDTYECSAARWCVGDPGVLRALWVAARAVGDADSAARVLSALEEVAAADASGDRLEGRLDLCCGAAALAQIYLRMQRETGEAVFRDANAALLARCAAGYERVVDPSFQYGRRGIVLAGRAAERDEDPWWDAMLGLSLPGLEGSRLD